MKRIALALSAALAATALAWAGPVEDREALMKERGQIMGALSKFAKGESPYDAAAVLTQLQALQANAEKTDVDVLWAADQTGNTAGTPATSPKVWEDIAAFKAEEEKYEAAVAAAVTAAPADVAALGAAMGPIGQECGTCHEGFRVRQ